MSTSAPAQMPATSADVAGISLHAQKVLATRCARTLLETALTAATSLDIKRARLLTAAALRYLRTADAL